MKRRDGEGNEQQITKNSRQTFACACVYPHWNTPVNTHCTVWSPRSHTNVFAHLVRTRVSIHRPACLFVSALMLVFLCWIPKFCCIHWSHCMLLVFFFNSVICYFCLNSRSWSRHSGFTLAMSRNLPAWYLSCIFFIRQCFIHFSLVK